MGKVHIESLVNYTTNVIKKEQEQAKTNIIKVVREAHETDPSFFLIPYNPFVRSNDVCSFIFALFCGVLCGGVFVVIGDLYDRNRAITLHHRLEEERCDLGIGEREGKGR